MRKTALTIFVISVATLMSACGGGSGGGSGSSGGGTPSGVVTQIASGLIPTAPAVGAVLYADAAPFRPMRVGSKWTYRGTTRTTTQSVETVYYDYVTQSSTGSGDVLESGSNVLNQGPSNAGSVLTAQSGTIRTTDSLQLFGRTEVVNSIELRSPIRVNDQYLVLDRTYADSGTDYDRDGKNDEVSVAIYKTVVGEEMLELASFPSANAVRVRTTALSRVKYSASGSFSETAASYLDQWYVSGIGLVKVVAD